MGRIENRLEENSPLNYYEDLGLSAAATSDQIREAYLTLVRLLHPDRQRDPSLRRAAEIQMQRVNHIYATLSDGGQRRRYDLTLQGMILDAPAPLRIGARVVPSFAWLACALVGIAGIGWYSAPEQDVSTRAAARPSARFEGPEMRAVGFGGAWFYSGAIIEKPGIAPYAAESIEMLISDERGKIRGSFRGQYSIPSRGVPSDVNFSFGGVSRGPIAVLPWWGDRGASGELQLRRLSEDTIEVVWAAAEVGQFLPLSSGTVQLVRRKTQ